MFSKVTTNMAKRLNIEICASIKNEIHLIVNPNDNDCASLAYELQKDGNYLLINNWTNESYPEVLKDEKGLRSVLKALVKV